MILNNWAEINATAGRPPSVFTRSANRASNPIATNARANHTVRKPEKTGPTADANSVGIWKEKRSDAATKPNTNLGKRSHTTPSPGFSAPSVFAPFLYVHQRAIKNATIPVKTF